MGRGSRPLRSILSKIDPSDVASIIPALNSVETRILIEALCSINRVTSTLLQLPEHQRVEIFSRLEESNISDIFKLSSDEDTARVISSFGEEEQIHLLNHVEFERREKVLRFLNLPEDSAGRYMQTDVFCLSSELAATTAIEELRKRAQNESIYYIYCVDGSGRLEGVVSLRQLVTCSPETQLQNLMRRELIFVEAHEDAAAAAELVSKYALIAIPVVNNDKRLLGVITVDDIVDLIKDQATAEVYAQAGLQEDDRVYTSSLKSVRMRLPWMMINLALAAVASSVVSLFEDTMSLLIVLASLKNIVAGVAGNTAIQSLTVVTRGIAVDDFQFISHFKAMRKELLTGVLIGVITGIAAGIMTYVWKGSTLVSSVMVISMFINSIVAASFGSAIPLILTKYKLDPATGSGPIVTMATDIFSFFSFLGIASLALKYFGAI